MGLFLEFSRGGWGYSDLGQFGSLSDKLSFFQYINTEKVDSIGVNNNFMKLVPNHHTEMMLQQLQQLQQQLEFGYFEKKKTLFFSIGIFSNPKLLKSV